MKEILVGAVGIELKATLKARKLLIPLNAKNGKNTEFAQPRYTPGTRRIDESRNRPRVVAIPHHLFEGRAEDLLYQVEFDKDYQRKSRFSGILHDQPDAFHRILLGELLL